MKKIDYQTVNLKDIKVEDKKIKIGSDAHVPTKRFWNSLFSRFGISDKVFRYYTHEEFFDRISSKLENTDIRVCTELGKESKLLAISNPKNRIMESTKVFEMLGSSDNVNYYEGKVTASFEPTHSSKMKIGGEDFTKKYVVDVPIDGYGKPNVFLEMLRWACENGLVAYSPAFRSSIPTGKDPYYSVQRAMESYDNDEGYDVLARKLELSQNSMASIDECMKLGKIVQKYEGKEKHMEKLVKLTGSFAVMYGIANFSEWSAKRRSSLPSKCTVYDLINFGSEISTHIAKPKQKNVLNAFLGELLAKDYDLEGSNDKKMKFQDRFLA